MKQQVLAGLEDRHKITNNSSEKIVVINSFNEKSIPTSTMYENKLTHLKTTDGKDTIQPGETKEILLTGNYGVNKEGNKQPGVIYSLLCTNPVTLFPLDSYIVDKIFTDNYPPHTIGENSLKNYKLGSQFYFWIQSYPTSRLATSFTQAVNEFIKSKKIQQIDNWFKDQPAYKELTFKIFSDVRSYTDTYPAMLMGKDISKTFYLYNHSESSGSPTQIKAPLYLGKVVLKIETSDLTTLDPNKRFTAKFISDSSGSEAQPLTLTYSKSNFSSEGEEEIFLQASFTSKSTLTNDPKDTEIIPLLIGQVNNLKVMGVTTKQNLQSSVAGAGSWYAFWHPASFQAWVNLFLILFMCGTVLMAAAKGAIWLYKGLKNLLSPSSSSSNLSEKETDQLLEEYEKGYREGLTSNYEKLGGLTKDVVKLEDLPEVARDLRRARSTLQSANAEIARTESLQDAMDMTKRVMEDAGGPDSEIEEIASQLRETNQEFVKNFQEFKDVLTSGRGLEHIRTENLDRFTEAFERHQEVLGKLLPDLHQWQNNRSEQLSQEMQEQVRKAQQTQIEAHEATDNLREEAKETEKGTEGEGEGIEDPDLPLPEIEII